MSLWFDMYWYDWNVNVVDLTEPEWLIPMNGIMAEEEEANVEDVGYVCREIPDYRPYSTWQLPRATRYCEIRWNIIRTSIIPWGGGGEVYG